MTDAFFSDLGVSAGEPREEPRQEPQAEPFDFESLGVKTHDPSVPRGFFETLTRGDFTPFRGLFGETPEEKMRAAQERVANDTYSDEDAALILDEYRWRQRPGGVLSKAAEVIPSSIQWGGEMAAVSLATGGLGTLASGTRTAGKVMQFLSAVSQANKGSKLAMSAAKILGRGALQVVASENVPKVTGGKGSVTRAAMRGAEESFWQGVKVSEDDKLAFEGTLEDFGASLPEETRRMFWEAVGEQGIPGGVLLKKFQRTLLKPLLGKGAGSKLVAKIAKGAKWDGVLPEIAEEYWTRVLQAADPELAESWGDVIPPPETILGEALGIAILGSGMSAASAMLPDKPAAGLPEPTETVEGQTATGAAREAPAAGPKPEEQAADVAAVVEPGPESAPGAESGGAAPAGPGTPLKNQNEGASSFEGVREGVREGVPEALTERFGPMEEVEATTPRQTKMAETAERLGTKVRFVQGEEADFIGASLEPGEVFVDAKSEDPTPIVYHELTHDFGRRTDGGIEALSAEIASIDPEGLAAARESYRQSFGPERFDALTEAAQGEEGVAMRAQELTAYLEALSTPDGRASIERLLAKPTLLQRLVEAIRRVASKLGIKGYQSNLETLSGLLGQEATIPAAQAAKAIKGALDSLVGKKVESRGQDGSTTPIKTGVADGHSHTYTPGAARTSFDDGHDHAVVDGVVQPGEKNGHTHTLDVADIREAAAYHGSAKDFDKFSDEFIGTGEGAQAFGHGHYFAGRKEVADYYKKAVGADAQVREYPDGYSDAEKRVFLSALRIGSGNSKTNADAVAYMRTRAKDARDYDREGRYFDAAADALEAGTADIQRGVGYQVDLAPAEDEYLLWDEPLSAQSEKVRAALGITDQARKRGEELRRRIERANRRRSGLESSQSMDPEPERYDAGIQKAREESLRLNRELVELGPDDSIKGSTHYDDTAEEMGGQRAASQALLAAGIRGIKYLDGTSRGKGEGSYNYVIFDPKDAKITGRFAASRKGGGAFRRADLLTPFDVEMTRAQAATRLFVDKLDPLRRFIDKLRGMGLFEDLSQRELQAYEAYLKAEAMPGKQEERYRRLKKHALDPLHSTLQSVMKRDGKSAEDVIESAGTFVLARHAQEANADLLEQYNAADEKGKKDFAPSVPEGWGSGMKDADAQAILKEHAGDELYQRIGTLTDRMNKRTLRIQVASGLISRENYNHWTKRFKHYVPTRTAEEDGAGPSFPSRPTGVSVKGPEVRRRLGRTSRPDNPLVFSAAQAEIAINRSEQNAVGVSLSKVLHKFSKDSIVKEYERPDQADWEMPKESFGYKVDGKEMIIRLHPELGRAMKNLGTVRHGKVVSGLHHLNRFLSSINTSLDPEFMLSNFTRDLQTAGVNMRSLDQKGLTRAVLKDMPGIMAALRRNFRGGEAKNENDQYINQYLGAGAKVGWFYATGGFAEKKKAIEKAVGEGRVHRAYGHIMKAIEDYNMMVENGVRASLFKQLIKRGVPELRAMSAAKNLTVNFNRHGELGPTINALYMFANAGIQGTATLYRNIKHPRVQRMVVGIAVMSAIIDQVNRMVTDDDDDGLNIYDKLPEHTKQRNLILMNPMTAKADDYISIPLPYGYNVINAIGRHVSELASGSKTVGKASQSLAVAFMESFNPIGGAQHLAQIVSPTVTDPAVDIMLNMNFAGHPIAPPDYGRDTPASQRSFYSVSKPAKVAAEWMNAMTGGDAVISGGVDVSPEHVDHLWDFATGGLGRLAKRISTMYTTPAQDLELRQVPFLRRFYGELPGYTTASLYYDAVHEVEMRSRQFEHHRKKGASETARELRKEHAGAIGLKKMAAKSRRRVKALRDAMRSEEDDDRKRELNQRMEAQMKQFTKTFLERYGSSGS